MFGSKGKNIKGRDVDQHRRNLLFSAATTVAPEGMDTNAVWLAAFQIVKPEASITYVCLEDGTTHAYFSNGHGHEHLEKGPSVPEAARTFVGLASRFYSEFEVASPNIAPAPRQVTFWARQGSETRALTLLEDVVAVGGHPMTKLYQAGVAVAKHCAASI